MGSVARTVQDYPGYGPQVVCPVPLVISGLKHPLIVVQ